jgi:hypothetical protein
MSLLEILRAIGKRPMMYIGDPIRNRCSVWHLQSFVVGFQSGRFGHVDDDDLILNGFDFWICTRYRINLSANWPGLLWLQSGKDDEAAFRLFFELLDDYLRDRELLGPDVLKARFMQMIEELPEDNDQ